MLIVLNYRYLRYSCFLVQKCRFPIEILLWYYWAHLILSCSKLALSLSRCSRTALKSSNNVSTFSVPEASCTEKITCMLAKYFPTNIYQNYSVQIRRLTGGFLYLLLQSSVSVFEVQLPGSYGQLLLVPSQCCLLVYERKPLAHQFRLVPTLSALTTENKLSTRCIFLSSVNSMGKTTFSFLYEIGFSTMGNILKM